jgi:hypothetical protein
LLIKSRGKSLAHGMINRDMTLTIMLSQKLNLVNIRIWSHSFLEKKKKKKRKMSMNNDHSQRKQQ